MIVLTRSNKFPELYLSKNIAGIPERFITKLKSRSDTFMLFTEGLNLLEPQSASLACERVMARYRCPISMSDCITYYRAIAANTWCYDLTKYAMYQALKGTINTIKITDLCKNTVEKILLPEPEFKESYEKIVKIIEYMLKATNQGTSIPMPEDLEDTDPYIPLGNIVWLVESIFNTLDGDFFSKSIERLKEDQCITMRCQGKIAVYNYEGNKKWKFREFAYRDGRSHQTRKDIPMYELMMDEMTFFKLDDKDFTIHDDIVPVPRFFDSSDKEYSISDLGVGNTYKCQVSYDVVTAAGTLASLKPISGCTFKTVELQLDENGVGETQVKINSNLFKFKIADKNKELPFKYFEVRQAKTDSMDWT